MFRIKHMLLFIHLLRWEILRAPGAGNHTPHHQPIILLSILLVQPRRMVLQDWICIHRIQPVSIQDILPFMAMVCHIPLTNLILDSLLTILMVVDLVLILILIHTMVSNTPGNKASKQISLVFLLLIHKWNPFSVKWLNLQLRCRIWLDCDSLVADHYLLSHHWVSLFQHWDSQIVPHTELLSATIVSLIHKMPSSLAYPWVL